MIYKALVEQLLRYGLVIWGGGYDSSMEQLTIIQNCIVKIMFRLPRLYATNQLYTCDICSLRTLYVISTCKFLHKNPNLKQYVSNKYHTRANSNQLLNIPSFRKNVNHRFVNYLGIKFYNLLPLEIRMIQKPSKFVKRCKIYVTFNLHLFMNIF